MSLDTDAPVELTPISDMPETGPGVLGMAEGQPHLLGSECTECATRFFPSRSICYACMSDSLTDVPLAREGLLYSMTTVHVSATRETPYTIGFIDLRDGVRVLAPISGNPLPELDTVVRLETDDDQWWFGVASTEEKK